MPRIRTNSSTPETRRREFRLLKPSSIDGKVKFALEAAKVIVRNSIEDDSQQSLSHGEESFHSD
ncbi:unnamed protein product, partial [Rotaria magnacalcarata]